MGSVLLIPIAWVAANPEVAMLIAAFVGPAFGHTLRKRWEAIRPKINKSRLYGRLVAAHLIAALATAAGLLAILSPICVWLQRAETLDIQFVNRELAYGLTLCYPPGTVDYFSLVAIVLFEYVVLHALIFLMLTMPLSIFKFLRRWVRTITVR